MAVEELPPPGKSPQAPDDEFGGLPYRLTGRVEDGLMTDVLQILAANQKSGRFSFFAPGEKKHLDLYFRHGEIIHAKAGDEEGESAFFSIMLKAHDAGKYGFLHFEFLARDQIEFAQQHFYGLITHSDLIPEQARKDQQRFVVFGRNCSLAFTASPVRPHPNGARPQ